jgi:4-diphosphocytidyl-2-C-methyl-D-erythritol kinase
MSALSANAVVTANAPGKVNLFFAVGALGTDGYHQVVSIYQALNLREKVTVEIAKQWQVSVTGTIPAEQLSQVPTDESNLVVKAAKALISKSEAGQSQAVNFKIFKNVPVAGGMGGGSADAAAALIAVNQLLNIDADQAQLHQIAIELGADVPFSILGGTAVGTGHGTALTQIDQVKQLNWVLVANPKGLSTPSVYKKLDEIRAAQNQDPTKVATPIIPQELISALQSGDPRSVAKFLHNDLQEAAISLMPELAETMEAGKSAGALAAMISGSGPTVALLALNKEHADSIAAELKIHGHSAIATDGPALGTLIEKN